MEFINNETVARLLQHRRRTRRSIKKEGLWSKERKLGETDQEVMMDLGFDGLAPAVDDSEWRTR
jgi:hypothetical protein